MPIVIREPFESQEHYDQRVRDANDRAEKRRADREAAKEKRAEEKLKKQQDREAARLARIEARQSGKTARVQTRQAGKGERVSERQEQQTERTQIKADAGYYDEGPGEAAASIAHDVTAGGVAVGAEAVQAIGAIKTAVGGGVDSLAGEAGGAAASAALQKAQPYLIGAGLLILAGILYIGRK